jgi:predicted Zn finger-like uncharacterized protein
LLTGVKHDARHMRIACSSCSATYDVPDSLVTPGRIVRCARCGNEWNPVAALPKEETPDDQPDTTPEQPSPVEEAAPEIRQSAMDRLSAHPATTASTLGLRIAWAVSLVVLLALVGSAYAWRTQLVSAWPPSARAYALFGMQPAHLGSPR